MKKALKITGIVLLILIIALIAAPFLFKSQLEDLVKKTINKNINATVAWQDLDLGLFTSFPDAALTINDFSVVNNAPFAGDTLASGKKLKLEMGLGQLFKSGDTPVKLDAITLDGAFINIKVDSLGHANYDIAKAEESPAPTKTTENQTADTSGGFALDLQHYELNNSIINYLDESSNTFLRLKNVNHAGNGDFAKDVFTLHTQTDALASLDFDGTNYLNDNSLSLKADIEMDLKNQKYTFKDNEALLNQLPLVFEGYVKINDNNNELDLSFKTPSSDFKNFLAVIPKEYAKNLDGVTTTGDFRVSGTIKGIVDETHIPRLDIAMSSDNASFKYPDLPKKVDNISIDAQVKNETGNVDDTYLRLGNLTFTIDQDTFAAKGRIDGLTTNPLVDLALNGKLNLANLEKAYPLELDQDLNGMLTVNMTTKFDMESVDKKQYQNIKSDGAASLRDFKYTSPDLPKPVVMSQTDLKFNTSTITLEKLNAQIGSTDLAATGTLENLIPFMVSNQKLKGRFNVQSNTIDLADFKTAETETKPEVETKTETKEKPKTAKTPTTEEAIKIPDFLDASLDFSANKVIYDNINLTNVKGTVVIKDQTASLKNVRSDIFGGTIALGGEVNTKNAAPTFDMDLDLSKVNIDQSFAQLDLLKGLAPIAKALQGAFNTDIKLKGNLNNDLTPVLTSLAGSAFAQLLTVKVDPQKMPLLNSLDQKLNFINLADVDLDNLKTNLSFDNGKISVKPFDFNVKGIKVNVSGSHNFDNTMNYTLALDVPGKFLGSQIGGTLAKLGDTNLNNYTVALPISLTGSFSNPNVSVNTQAAVTNLTQQIVASQKDKLKEKGEKQIGNIIGNVLGNKAGDSTAVKTNKDTTNTQVKNAVKNVLGGLLNKKKKPADTTKGN